MQYEAKGEEAEYMYQWCETYQIVQCLGCDDISFRQISSNSEDYDLEKDEYSETEHLYPDRISGRQPISDYEKFPEKTKAMYLETLKALNNKIPILAAIGLRAIVESICLEQKTKSKNLAEGIDELAKMGLISTKQAEFLHNHRFMGNEAAHEIVAPKPQYLVPALDIAETLLKTIYVLPSLSDKLKKLPTKQPNPPK
jgi:hypothetical protein